MTARRRLAFGPALTLALAVAAPSLAPAADVVRLVPGSTVKNTGGQISGQILAETPTELTIKPPVGGEQKVPVDQIASVEYDGAPPSYLLGQARENTGTLVEAAELYQKAVGEAQGKELLQRSAAYRRASVLADIGLADPDAAAAGLKALDEFLKAHPQSRQVGPALETLVRLSLQQNDAARAEAAVNDLARKVPAYRDRADVLKARVMVKKGQTDQALAELDRILAKAPQGSAQAREALLARAEALVAAKQFDQAEEAVRKVIDQAPPEDASVQAMAHNVLGDCLRAAGRPKDALIAYLKTDVLYSSDKSAHPRALAMIAQLWTELRQEARAGEVLERLRQLYPQSPYAKGQLIAPR
jgi:tetratricopeptide (TPR) repeat protein